VTHFRTRCRFALAPDPDADDSSPASNDLHYLLWEGGTASKQADSFPGAVEGICQLMDPVRIGVSRDPRLRQGVRAVHFMSNTKADDRVVTLVYDQVHCHFRSSFPPVVLHVIEHRVLSRSLARVALHRP
jgi:hypothetical protein